MGKSYMRDGSLGIPTVKNVENCNWYCAKRQMDGREGAIRTVESKQFYMKKIKGI